MLTLLPFAATAFVIELTPGPNMGYLAILSAREGRRAGFAATLGIAVGLSIIGLAAALGLTAIVAASPSLYDALRWAGTLYLLWLAWESWQAEEGAHESTRLSVDHSRFFMRGLITNLLNPKAGLFYVATLPSFMDAGEPVLRQVVVLTSLYVAIATLVHSGIVILAGAAQPWLENPARRLAVRRILAATLALVAVWLFVSTKYG